MPRRILADANGITIVWGDAPLFSAATAKAVDLHGSVRNKPNDDPDKLAAMKDMLQSDPSNGIDRVIPLSSLPIDDPDRTIDPGLEAEFWDGAGNMIVRRMIVEEITWQPDRNRYRPMLRQPGVG